MKLTQQGVIDIKNAPQRVEEAVKGLEALGGQLVAFYVTMGEYDFVGIAELPDDEAAMKFLMRLGRAGSVRTTTMKAFSIEEVGEILRGLP
jgi:uncharacterized protein with GYD domain